MTRLDQNRAVGQLAARSGAPVTEINNVTIWGNHSATQYPDFYNATIGGRGAVEVIGDESWLQGEFIKTVQQRGGAVIKSRGASSAASAANAIIDSVKSIVTPTAAGSSFSAAVCSDGSYGVEQGLISSFPLASDGTSWSVVGGLQHNEFGAEKLAATVAELKSERDMVRDLLAS
jgi:malate dehydrogenase